MRIVLEISDSDIPKEQDIIMVPIHFIDGTVCEAGGYGFYVIPKGTGRLIDADDIDNHIIGHVDTRSCPTIIEADKGYDIKVINRGNCMMCGKPLTEGLFLCKECEDKANNIK